MPRLPAFLLLVLAVQFSASQQQHASRVIRFVDSDGQVRTGSPIKSASGLHAQLVECPDAFGSLALTDTVVKVKTLLAPVPPPPVILGIGLNYWGHINSTHLDPPKTPSIFSKFRHSYNHPMHPIVIPPFSSKPDYEGELAFVFGKDCKDVSEDDALSCVLGYTICHDVSARCYQSDKEEGCPGNGGQFSFSKGLDTHAPLGPVLVGQKELGDGSNLILSTKVNGALRQNITTSELIYGVKKIVAFMTMGTTVDRGTVVCSGTPDGVGDTMKPPVYLEDGDVVDITIEKIGTLSNKVARPNSTEAYRAISRNAGPEDVGDLNQYIW